MSTFRSYGGINNSLYSNFVKHNIFNSSNLSFNTSGQINSKELFLSNIDMSGNSLLHIGGIYFQDGTSMNNIIENPTLSDILSNGNKANKNIDMNFSNGLENIGKIIFSNGKIQEGTYIGFVPNQFQTTTYNYASIKINTNGQILEIKDNKDNVIPTLSQVLTKGNNASNNDILNIGELKLNNLNTLNLTLDGMISQTNNLLNYFNDTSFNDVITQNENIRIKQNNSGQNILYSTTFNNVSRYLETFNFNSDDNIPDVGYVNNIVNSSLTPTASCNCATTTNINLTLSVSAIGSIDGYNVVVGNRVLVKNQSIQTQNGIYECTNILSPYVRTIDYSNGTNVANYATFINGGNTNKFKLFAQINNPGIVNSNNLFYVIIYSVNYNRGRGLLLSGTTLSVDPSLDFITSSSITYRNGPNTAFMLNNLSSSKSIFSVINSENTSYYNNLSQQGDNLIISGLLNEPLVLASYNGSATSTGIKLLPNILTIQRDSNTYVTMNDSAGIKIYGNLNKIKNYSINSSGHIFNDICNFKNGINYKYKTILTYNTPNTLGYRILNSSFDANWVSMSENNMTNNPSGNLFGPQTITGDTKYLLIFNMDVSLISGPNNNDGVFQLDVQFFQETGPSTTNNHILTFTFGGFILRKGYYTTLSKNAIITISLINNNIYINYKCFLRSVTNGNWSKKLVQYTCQLIRLS